MKTTIEIPDLLFRQAKSRAAERGQTLKEFVTEALQERLQANASKARPGQVGESSHRPRAPPEPALEPGEIQPALKAR